MSYAAPERSMESLVRPVLDRVLRPDPEYAKYGRPLAPSALPDYLFGLGGTPNRPSDVFPKLSWGGQFVFVSRRGREARALAEEYARGPFVLEQPPRAMRVRPGLLGFLGPRVHYFIARKLCLIQPGEVTNRFTYDVQLARRGGTGEYVVRKQVPTLEELVHRLMVRHPDVPEETIISRARKFTDKIFPTFLTREAAMLMILQDHLPRAYAQRVPRVLSLEKDDRGFVRRFEMNWLRIGGQPLSQMEFAQQSADLLRAVHDVASVIHLDLRLDNFVVSDRGVGFVDFGSAVRTNEQIEKNPLLSTIYGELMRTSQIQRMLDAMTRSGHVTAEHFCRSRGRIDKAVDLFYLAVQLNSPHANPDLRGHIDFSPDSRQASAIQRFTRRVLKPEDPANPTVRSAKDMLRELETIGRGL